MMKIICLYIENEKENENIKMNCEFCDKNFLNK